MSRAPLLVRSGRGRSVQSVSRIVAGLCAASLVVVLLAPRPRAEEHGSSAPAFVAQQRVAQAATGAKHFSGSAQLAPSALPSVAPPAHASSSVGSLAATTLLLALGVRRNLAARVSRSGNPRRVQRSGGARVVVSQASSVGGASWPAASTSPGGKACTSSSPPLAISAGVGSACLAQPGVQGWACAAATPTEFFSLGVSVPTAATAASSSTFAAGECPFAALQRPCRAPARRVGSQRRCASRSPRRASSAEPVVARRERRRLGARLATPVRAEPCEVPFDASRVRTKVQCGLQLHSFPKKAGGRERRTKGEATGTRSMGDVGSQTTFTINSMEARRRNI